MPIKIEGETILGNIIECPLSQSGDTTLYVWPLRCLNNKTGGPTFGIDANGEEALRFDAHGERGHWHSSYARLGVGGSQQHFPEELIESESQLTWALSQVREKGQKLLTEAGYPEAAASLDQSLVLAATQTVVDHLKQEGDVRSKGIELGVIEA